jgi:hypothetical protein
LGSPAPCEERGERQVVTVARAGAAYFGILVYLSQFLPGTQKYDALEAGVALLAG